MKIGYIRISTLDQNTARQEVLMEALEVDEIYIDRMSGKSADRPEIAAELKSCAEVIAATDARMQNLRLRIEALEKQNI